MTCDACQSVWPIDDPGHVKHVEVFGYEIFRNYLNLMKIY